MYLSVSHQSVQLWLLISLVLKAPQVVFGETDLDLIAHSSGDMLLIGHVSSLVHVFQLQLYSYVRPLSVFV